MRTLCILAALAIFPAFGQQCGTWTIDGITIPRSCPTVLDQELKKFSEWRATFGAALPAFALDYWEKRLELARELDAGKLSADAYTLARKAQDEMLSARADSEAARARDEYIANQARMAAEQQAQQEAADARRQQAAIGLAAQLLRGRAPPAPSYGGAATGGPAFFKGEQSQGFNKICYYDRVGSAVAITVGATDLCPLSIP